MKSLPIRPIRTQSIPEAIIRELESLIDSGFIPEGSKLPPERELAKILNVSRPSLRVAIKVLSLLGILENRQGDGTYLTDSNQWTIEPLSIMLSMKKGALLDIFEARESIENSCAGFAALRRDEEDLCEMQRALDNMHSNYDNPDKYIEYDLNFHKAVIFAAKNPVFVDLMEKIYRLLVDTRNNSRRYPSELYREKNFQQHVKIFESIKNSDFQKATTAMAQHMGHIKRRLMERTVRQVTNP
ncbi:MAG: FadR family transcriptional regulator [Deltaproteobacteria bacterium]|nr:FadR family transcriptional regulator [Deltaproteobacteria bacterium]MBW2136598.1 FadR family transcriptional regulator [Deltaproteobacteria bacterium]